MIAAREYRDALTVLIDAIDVERHPWLLVVVDRAMEQLSTCVHCGQTATGWAFVGVDRLCHGGGRSCYDVRVSHRMRAVSVEEMGGTFEGGPDSVSWLRDQRER